MNDRYTTLSTLRDPATSVLSPRQRDRSSRPAWGRVVFCTMLVLGLIGFSLVVFSSLGLSGLQGVTAFIFLWLILCMLGSQ